MQIFPGLPKGVYSAERKEGSPNTLGFPPNTLGYFRKNCSFSLCFVGVRRIHSNLRRIQLLFGGASPNTLEYKRSVFSGRIHSNLAGYTRISLDTFESRRIHSVSPNTLARRIHSNPNIDKDIWLGTCKSCISMFVYIFMRICVRMLWLLSTISALAISTRSTIRKN